MGVGDRGFVREAGISPMSPGMTEGEKKSELVEQHSPEMTKTKSGPK